jgi:hypothetical protein
MPFNPMKYGLALPPNQRQLGAVRNSPVRSLLARYRGLSQRQPGLMAGRRPSAKPQVRQPARPPVIGGKLFKPGAPVKPYQVTRTRTVRDALGIITDFARQNKMVRLSYRRMRDGAVVTRDVEPYSLRYRKSRAGGRARYFYAFDTGPGNSNGTIGIHAFRMSNILSVEGTNRIFVPKWIVEF